MKRVEQNGAAPVPHASLTDPATYRIGPRIRAMRLARSMGLVELGRHTGLSASLLSKLETGKALPTLPTLQRIAMVFSVGLDHFFGRDETAPLRAVVRRADRLRFPAQPGGGNPGYWFESLDFPAVNRKMSAYMAEFEPETEGGVPTHEHEGAELLYVMSGTLALWHDGERLVLEEGDSVYFDPARAHGYGRIGNAACRALVVTVP